MDMILFAAADGLESAAVDSPPAMTRICPASGRRCSSHPAMDANCDRGVTIHHRDKNGICGSSARRFLWSSGITCKTGRLGGFHGGRSR
jgi:hypothetical protein